MPRAKARPLIATTVCGQHGHTIDSLPKEPTLLDRETGTTVPQFEICCTKCGMSLADIRGAPKAAPANGGGSKKSAKKSTKKSAKKSPTTDTKKSEKDTTSAEL